MPALGWGLDPFGAVSGWSGVAASVASVTSGVATITGLANMSPLSVGRYLTLYDTASAENNGTFAITEYVDAGSVKVANPNAIAPDGNNGSIKWVERLRADASVYGAATSGAGTSILKALAVSTRDVQVSLSGEPLRSSAFGSGDALNPATWSVQRLDTAVLLTPVNVVAISPLVYQITTLEEFGPVEVTHRISSSTLLDSAGNLLKPPRQADFAGVLNEDAVKSSSAAARQRGGASDLANYPATVQLEGLGGTLRVSGGGDYVLVSGAELVRKLIMRRLVTRPGDFFHLPAYGIGVSNKEPVTGPALGRLRDEVVRQVKLEPEVQEASASLLLDSNGILTAQVRAKLRATGQAVDVTQELQSGVTL